MDAEKNGPSWKGLNQVPDFTFSEGLHCTHHQETLGGQSFQRSVKLVKLVSETRTKNENEQKSREGWMNRLHFLHFPLQKHSVAIKSHSTFPPPSVRPIIRPSIWSNRTLLKLTRDRNQGVHLFYQTVYRSDISISTCRKEGLSFGESTDIRLDNCPILSANVGFPVSREGRLT